MRVVNEHATRAETLKSLQAHYYELQGHRVYLFGSRARGNAGRCSDFDIGIDGSKPLDLSVFFEIKDSLERIPTLYQFDLVDLNRASSKLRESARREGRLLYEA
jgi:predicted nucleotidyltransferase